MVLVELIGQQPGYADLSIKRWKGPACDSLEVAIQRNQDAQFLRAANEWSGEITWHRIEHVEQQDDQSLLVNVGPWLVDPIVQQEGSVKYLLHVRVDGFEDKGTVRFTGNVLASSAAGAYERESDIRDAPEITPTVEPIAEEIVAQQSTAEVEPVVEEATPPITEPVVLPENSKRKTSVGLIIGLIALLFALIAGAIWYFLFANKEKEDAVEPPQPPALTACTVQANVDEMAFLQACLQTNPDDDALWVIIEEAKKEKQCGIAQRIYVNKAASGDAAFALAYAKEYDSEFAQADGCFNPDKDQALYWYNTVLESEPNHAEAKKRIEELSK